MYGREFGPFTGAPLTDIPVPQLQEALVSFDERLSRYYTDLAALSARSAANPGNLMEDGMVYFPMLQNMTTLSELPPALQELTRVTGKDLEDDAAIAVTYSHGRPHRGYGFWPDYNSFAIQWQTESDTDAAIIRIQPWVHGIGSPPRVSHQNDEGEPVLRWDYPTRSFEIQNKHFQRVMHNFFREKPEGEVIEIERVDEVFRSFYAQPHDEQLQVLEDFFLPLEDAQIAYLQPFTDY